MSKKSTLVWLFSASLLLSLGGCSSADSSKSAEGSLAPISVVSLEESGKVQEGEDSKSPNTVIGYLSTSNRVPIFGSPKGITIGTSEEDALAVYGTENGWAKVKTSKGYGWVDTQTNGVSFRTN